MLKISIRLKHIPIPARGINCSLQAALEAGVSTVLQPERLDWRGWIMLPAWCGATCCAVGLRARPLSGWQQALNSNHNVFAELVTT